ncbi:MAG: alpha/beta hydrolase [Planctomycetota bacterium]|nr:alpha/beta hydrolase [Planctomycetota bacterium]
MITSKHHLYKSDLRAGSALAVQATLSVTSIVEKMQHSIVRVPFVSGPVSHKRARALTGAVYGIVRGVTKTVGWSLDKVFAKLSDPDFVQPTEEREIFVAALNGVLGDHLAKTSNSLAIPMTFRSEGKALKLTSESLKNRFPKAGSKLLVLLHGLCMTDSQWTRQGHNHGVELARELGYTSVYLRYNSGLHISENGRLFANQLTELIKAWPVDIEEITLLGHSMGGLVARSACHIASELKLDFLPLIKRVIFLGSPHFGAPLERMGHGLELILGLSPYTVALRKLGELRSAGITDLRHGNLRDEDWQGRGRFDFTEQHPDPLPMPESVSCLAIAGSLSKWGRLGDGMVPLKSALGQKGEAMLFEERQVIRGINHLDLLNNKDVYNAIHAHCAD